MMISKYSCEEQGKRPEWLESELHRVSELVRIKTVGMERSESKKGRSGWIRIGIAESELHRIGIETVGIEGRPKAMVELVEFGTEWP